MPTSRSCAILLDMPHAPPRWGVAKLPVQSTKPGVAKLSEHCTGQDLPRRSAHAAQTHRRTVANLSLDAMRSTAFADGSAAYRDP